MSSDIEIAGQYAVAHVIDEDSNNIIERVMNDMDDCLGSEQKTKLKIVLTKAIFGVYEEEHYLQTLERFAKAKLIEGRSKKTVDYYCSTLRMSLEHIDKPLQSWTSNDVRRVLSWYKNERGCNDTTVNNIKRNMSSFFQWLVDEDVITKSPVKKVKLKEGKKTRKEPFSEVELDAIRCACKSSRERAIIELLNSSGMRVGELANLKIQDVNLSDRTAYVTGKGNKSRYVYFSETARKYLEEYIKSRNDSFDSLILNACATRPLCVGSIESLVRTIGERARVRNCHPHRFRRTMATRNLDRGMPIEEIQILLGHEKIETTLIYANPNNERIRTNARLLM